MIRSLLGTAALALGLYSSSLFGAVLNVTPTKGERLIIWNSTSKTFQCPIVTVGESYAIEFDAQENDRIYVYQTDRTCYQDYGLVYFQVDDSEGVYDIEF